MTSATAPLTGQLQDNPAIEVLCGMAARRSTGRLDISDGRRRWVFHLEEGRLEMSQSNVRSEQLQALQESAPEADPRELTQLQVTIRMLALAELTEGEWSFTSGEPPPKRRPADLLAACWQALQRRYTPERIDARLGPLADLYPDLGRGALRLSDLPLDPSLKALLSDLDGQRPLAEILDFAPVDPNDARRAMLFGVLTGVVDFGDAATHSEIRVFEGGGPTDGEQDLISEMVASTLSMPPGEIPEAFDPSPTVTASAPPDPTDDISALIAQQIGQPPPPPRERNVRKVASDPDMARLQAELDRIRSSKNEFEVLGITWDASEDDYRHAYFRMARDFHPDRWSTRTPDHAELADQIFARVSAAWEKLGEAGPRQAYIDRVVHGKKTEEELAMEKVQLIFAADGDFKTAMKHFRAGRLTQANEIFQSCAQRVPEELIYTAYWGYTTFRLNHGKNQEEADRGIEMLRVAIDQSAKFDEGWTLLGQAYRTQNEDDMARRCFVQALKINPSNPDAYREMKRLQVEKEKDQKKSGGGWFSNLFGGKDKDKEKK